jgi:hypothetical protein
MQKEASMADFTPDVTWFGSAEPIYDGQRLIGSILRDAGFVALSPAGSAVGTYLDREAAERGLRNVYAPHTVRRAA